MIETKHFDKKKFTFDNSSISVTVFGPGYGESIVIYLPGLGWGLIDSCSIKIKKQNINPALELLKTLNVKRLSFLILTHPHLDHYKGLEDILNYYKGSIDRICYYAGEGLREYARYLCRKKIINEPGLKSFSHIFDLVEEAKKQGTNVMKISERTEIIRKKKFQDHTIEMIALSPSEDSIKSYCELLHRYIPTDNSSPIKEIQDKDHNLVSSAIWCQIDNVKLIFGSDLENGFSAQSGWSGVLNNIDSPDLSASLVKIPHHGSPTAYNEDAWKLFSKDKKPISIVTPYSKTHAPLPDHDILNEIKKYSKGVYITSKSSDESPKKIYKDIPIENLFGIKSWSYIKLPQQIGYVNTSFKIGDDHSYEVLINNPAFQHS